MKVARSLPVSALLPWLAAGFVWTGIVAPLRVEQSDRLAEQSRIRRDRVKADRTVRETSVLRDRVEKALGGACRASADPSEIRQRVVAASSGLSLSPFSLTVSGPPGAGASIDVEGTRGSVLAFARRLGNTSGGGFLRTVSLRDRGLRWGVSAMTGVIEGSNFNLPSLAAVCGNSSAYPGTEAPVAPKAVNPPRLPKPRVLPSPAPAPTPLAAGPLEAGPSMAPFTLLAFVTAEGKVRVSVRTGDEIRVVSVGDVVSGWTCISIDADDGAVFQDASSRLVVLKAR